MTHAIILCTRNRPTDILQALASITKQIRMPDEIIVVDSSTQPLSTHAPFTTVFVPAIFHTTKLHYLHTKPGLPVQRNSGAQIATADIIHFIDDDVVLEPLYIEQMELPFMQEQFVGGMGYITNIGAPASRKFRLFRTLFCLPRDYSTGKWTLSGFPTFPYGTTTFKTVNVTGGCCMSFRRPAFLAVKADESLSGYAYMEDIDIAFRIQQFGKLFYQPTARLAHYNSPVARERQEFVAAMFVRNYTYLFFKNWYEHGKWRIMWYWWSVLGLFLQAALQWDRPTLRGYWTGLKKDHTRT